MSVSNVGTLRNHSATSGTSLDAEQGRALFQLMGQLEQILVRMDEFGASKRLPGYIEVAKELLIELVEFSERPQAQYRGPASRVAAASDPQLGKALELLGVQTIELSSVR